MSKEKPRSIPEKKGEEADWEYLRRGYNMEGVDIWSCHLPPHGGGEITLSGLGEFTFVSSGSKYPFLEKLVESEALPDGFYVTVGGSGSFPVVVKDGAIAKKPGHPEEVDMLFQEIEAIEKLRAEKRKKES